MKSLPTLKSAMTPFPYSVQPDANLAQAQELMKEHRVRHLPVTEAHEVVAIITKGDIAAALASAKGKGKQDRLKVKDVAVNDVFIVDLNEPIENVLLTMAERRISSAIVTRQGRFAGVFTSSTNASRSPSINASFFARRHPFTCRSAATASSMRSNHCEKTSVTGRLDFV